jgi:O-antigen/teichoic acid export membrane protein
MRQRHAILLLWVANLTANSAGWVFTLLANRSLSLEQMGNLGFYTNLTALVSIASVAFGVSTNRFQALYVKNKQSDNYGYTATFGSLAALVGGFILVLYLLLAPWWTKSFAFPFQWPLLLVTGATFVIMFPLAWLRSVWQAHALFLLVGIGLLCEAATKVALGLVAGSSSKPFFWFMASMGISALVALLVIYIPKHRLLKQVTHKLKPLDNEQWNFLGQTILQRIGMISLLTVDILFAKYFLPPEQAGIYALLSLSGKIVYFLTQSIYVLVTPLISPYLEQTKKRRYLFGAIMGSAFVFISGVIFLYTWLPSLSLGLMLGERYSLIQPYIFRYSVASGLLSLALIATLYKLLRQQYLVSAFVLVGLVVEVVLMMRFHQTLDQLVNNVLWSAIALVTMLVVTFGCQSLTAETKKNSAVL